MEYRFYYMDDLSRIYYAKYLDCADDAEALQHARSIEHHQFVEVWQGGRRVERLQAKPIPARAPQADPRIDRDERM